MTIGTFAGRFRHNTDARSVAHRIDGQHAGCTCTADSTEKERNDRRLAALTRFKEEMEAIAAEQETTDENLQMSSGLPAEEVAAKERREREEAEERERQERADVETARRASEVSHRPPEHEHQPGEAYGIRQNLGDALSPMERFMDGVQRKYNTRKAPTNDEVARMNPTERFVARCEALRRGRR